MGQDSHPPVTFHPAIVGSNQRSRESGIVGGFNLGYCVCWSPDGRWLAAGSGRMDPSVWVWNAQTGQREVHIEMQNGSVFALAWSPDSQRLVAATADGSVVILEATTWRHLMTLRGHRGQPTAMGFSFDGSWLASKADDSTVILWNCGNWKELARLPESGCDIACSAALPFIPYDRSWPRWGIAGVPYEYGT